MKTEQHLARFVDRHTMVYDRRYAHPIERVWEAVSTGEHLSVWLLPVTRVERRAGGKATFTWGGLEEDGIERFVVQDFDPPTLITFVPEGRGGYFRFELEPDGADATVLHFTLHWPVPADAKFEDEQWPGGDLPAGGDTLWRPGQLSGFHGMLENLAGFLDGTWTKEVADAFVEGLRRGDPTPPEHVDVMEQYRVFVREHCPSA